MTNRYPEMPPRNPNPPYKRIAAEEAWLPPEIMNLYIKGLEDGSIQDPGFRSLWGFFAQSKTEKAQAHFRRIQTLGEERLADMDGSGIDMQVVALSSPGVQVFEAKQASALARSASWPRASRPIPTAMSGLPPSARWTSAAPSRSWSAGSPSWACAVAS